MTRTKGSKNKIQARTHGITIKLNDAELATQMIRATEAGLKLAVYIRRALK